MTSLQEYKELTTNGKCNRCGKPVVWDQDWGDYDDACEWACTCRHYEWEGD